MRAPFAAAIAVALLLAVAACGNGDDDEQNGTTATAPPAPAGALSWERAFARPEDRRVRIHLTTVPCRLPLQTVRVEEAGDAVTVTVTGKDVPEGTPCVQVAARRCILIELERPLGERPMIDGANGERRPVERTGGDELRCERA